MARDGLTVHVDRDLQARLSRPLDGSVEIIGSSLNVRVSFEFLEGPITDGDSHEVEAILGDLLKVAERDPGVPVISEHLLGFWDVLREGVLVNGGSSKSFKYRRSDPGF